MCGARRKSIIYILYKKAGKKARGKRANGTREMEKSQTPSKLALANKRDRPLIAHVLYISIYTVALAVDARCNIVTERRAGERLPLTSVVHGTGCTFYMYKKKKERKKKNSGISVL